MNSDLSEKHSGFVGTYSSYCKFKYSQMERTCFIHTNDSAQSRSATDLTVVEMEVTEAKFRFRLRKEILTWTIYED